MDIKIIDILPSYIKMRNGIVTFDDYRRTYPAFFNHYFAFWGKGESIEPVLSEEEISLRRTILLKYLAAAETACYQFSIDLSNISALVFIGQDTANGHAFLDSSKAVAWYALERFSSEKQFEVFVIHELIHAVQYSNTPEAFFYNTDQKNLVYRQLITEGIATYLTTQLCSIDEKESLWADVLPSGQLNHWMSQCQAQEEQLFEFVLKHYDSSDPKIGLFHSSDSNDIYENRTGYYVGLKVIQQIVQEDSLTPLELLKRPMKSLVERTYQT